MLRIIPRDDRRTALRLKRQLMAVYSYVFVWLGVRLGMELGYFDPHTPHLLLFGITIGLNLVVFILIRSGWSERLPDPSLTVPQLVIGIVLITLLLHYTQELRGAMLSIYFMAMTFGVLSLTRAKMILMSIFVVLCFGTLVAWEWIMEPEAILWSITIGYFSILVLGLTWFVYVGGYIRNLQHRVRRQRSELRRQQDALEDANHQLNDAMTRLEQLAIRDQLTELFNRRHFLERLEEELARAERSNGVFHIAIIDLDHFKRINDSYGHNAGDEVLKRFAETARDTLRRSDVLARYGGEEFICLFPEGSGDDIRTVMERLRDTFAHIQYGHLPEKEHVTLSAGIGASRPGDNATTLTERADRALYRAKREGRNRVVVAGEGERP